MHRRISLTDPFVELAGVQSAVGEMLGEPVHCPLPVGSAGPHLRRGHD
jgi:hypothetical protein